MAHQISSGLEFMMGEIFRDLWSSPKRMAYSFLRLFGKEEKEGALRNWILVSIPALRLTDSSLLAPIARLYQESAKVCNWTSGCSGICM